MYLYLHQNTKLMFIGSKLPTLNFTHYRHILNAKQLYEFAVNEITGMNFCYVTSKEYDYEAQLLHV